MVATTCKAGDPDCKPIVFLGRKSKSWKGGKKPEKQYNFPKHSVHVTKVGKSPKHVESDYSPIESSSTSSVGGTGKKKVKREKVEHIPVPGASPVEAGPGQPRQSGRERKLNTRIFGSSSHFTGTKKATRILNRKLAAGGIPPPPITPPTWKEFHVKNPSQVETPSSMLGPPIYNGADQHPQSAITPQFRKSKVRKGGWKSSKRTQWKIDDVADDGNELMRFLHPKKKHGKREELTKLLKPHKKKMKKSKKNRVKALKVKNIPKNKSGKPDWGMIAMQNMMNDPNTSADTKKSFSALGF